jgi:hypothetical protein
MKQLIRGRSGRKNTAQATLKFGFQAAKTGGNLFGWQSQKTKKSTIVAPPSSNRNTEVNGS